jgi:serine-type D-Ala-D-Ala carboxypeptidase/endopeptidase (penicillin-binding protein 4)
MNFSHFFLSFFTFFAYNAHSQSVNKQLELAINRFNADPQVKYAQFSLYVMDANTGEVLLDRNGQTGMATASCLKLVTSATAFELLGKDYRFKTMLRKVIDKEDVPGDTVLRGDLLVMPGGDPSLGSWRWPSTKENQVLEGIIQSIKKQRIRRVAGAVHLMADPTYDITPGGWTWDDLGNYYGAPARQVNWHENQFDIEWETEPAKNRFAQIKSISPAMPGVKLKHFVKTAAAGTGDQTIIYLAPFASSGFITGSLPMAQKSFTTSGALPEPDRLLAQALTQRLLAEGLIQNDSVEVMHYDYNYSEKKYTLAGDTVWTAIESPPLDSLNYWFMRRSINLYGEAFIKQIAYKGFPVSSTKKGCDTLKAFWKSRGIEPGALNIYDGSGLSPQNRVTTKALATVLQYARKQPWFSSYYHGFPEYNGMKLKSGTIADVKGFAGYHKAKNGREYIIAFLVNNYSGKSSDIVGKMYKVLDVLK